MSHLRPAGDEPTTLGTPCSLCGADDAVEVLPSTLGKGEHGEWSAYACTSGGYGRHGPIVRCRQCGLVYAAPRPAHDEVLDLYTAVQDPLYVAERAGRILTFENHLKPMGRFARFVGGAVCWMWSAYTWRLRRNRGRARLGCWGVEPSAWAVEEARRRGLQMVPAPWKTGASPPVATASSPSGVIEHVDNLQALQAAGAMSSREAYLVVHPSDLNSLFARLMKRWPWFMEMHLTYFTRATLYAMLVKAGFSVTWMGAQGRYLHAGYLASRVTALFLLSGALERIVTAIGLDQRRCASILGDLFTTYAHKPSETFGNRCGPGTRPAGRSPRKEGQAVDQSQAAVRITEEARRRPSRCGSSVYSMRRINDLSYIRPHRTEGLATGLRRHRLHR